MMSNRLGPRMALTAVLLLSFAIAGVADAADRPQPTVITVGEMCGGCVKKITKHFDGARGIADVACDIKSKTVTILPARGYVLSPRGLWEAMEQIGKPPKRLVGPSGTFTSKPPK